MQNTEKALFKLIAVGLGKVDLDIAEFPNLLDWFDLYKLSIEQGVNAVAVDGLQKLLQKYPNNEKLVVKDSKGKTYRMQ